MTQPIHAPHIPSAESHDSFALLKLYQRISQSPRQLWMFCNMVIFLWQCIISISPNSQAGGPLVVGCPRLRIQYIHGYLPYWRPFLHPQPEDPPCRGESDPVIVDSYRRPLIKPSQCTCYQHTLSMSFDHVYMFQLVCANLRWLIHKFKTC